MAIKIDTKKDSEKQPEEAKLVTDTESLSKQDTQDVKAEIIDEPKTEQQPPKQEDKQQDTKEKKKISFLDETSFESFVESREEKNPEEESTETTIPGAKSESEKSKETINEVSAKDSDLFSELLVEGIDWIVSFGLAAYARDKNTVSYELTKAKKDKMTYLLSKIVVSKGWSISPEFMFIMFLGMAYKEPFELANENRNIDVPDEKRESYSEEHKVYIERKRGPGRPKKQR